ncbi:MAG: aminopeptidase P family protein [Bacteriovoracaceae bacterium]|jgi:Xaa-Pro aminopeptidase|nr:aminopeptidase P family protein [Bacteriovoracaceae bacterium]
MHSVGEKFNLDTYIKTRQLTREAVESAALLIVPGTNQAEGQKIIKTELEKRGMTERWHPTKLRIGPDTLKTFSQKADQLIRLQENDLFFIDVGPIFEQHEGDYGQTYTVGSNSQFEELAAAARDIFIEVQGHWRAAGISGIELYKIAAHEAAKRGLELNTKMDGHRLGDFPHGLFHKGSLIDCSETPIQNVWVLEILLKDPKQNLGSFFEDILI